MINRYHKRGSVEHMSKPGRTISDKRMATPTKYKNILLKTNMSLCKVGQNSRLIIARFITL